MSADPETADSDPHVWTRRFRPLGFLLQRPLVFYYANVTWNMEDPSEEKVLNVNHIVLFMS